MIRAIIVEDEFKSRELLNTLVTKNCEGISILACASNVAEGAEAIFKTRSRFSFS